MDVTSLLNSSSAAAILQRRDSVGSSTPSATGDTTATSTAVPTPSPERTPPRRMGSRSPIRNRTPWDAGGYSLPLALDTKSIPSLSESTSHPSFYPNSSSGSPTGCCDAHPSSSPKSAHHKFSDSHSSLSSSFSATTSSGSSLSHSRISSLSTVSEFQPLPTLLSDLAFDKPDLPLKKLASGPDHPTSSSPFLCSATFDGSRDPNLRSTSLFTSPKAVASGRPRSPSEVAMAGRHQDPGADPDPMDVYNHSGAQYSLATGSRANGSYRSQSPGEPRQSQNGNNTGENESSLVPRDGRPLHKRAVSAPDFAAMSSSSTAHSAHPDDGYHPDIKLIVEAYGPLFADMFADFYNDVNALEAQRANIENDILSNSTACKVPNGPCVLQSPPRKIITHLFGRNKSCTRDVPNCVWPHYCRKHYQRYRYRDSGGEFCLLQAGLVIEAIFRIQVWCDTNVRAVELKRANGEITADPLIVQDWSLGTRKRDQKRREEKMEQKKAHLNANNKRPHADNDGLDEEANQEAEDDDDDDNNSPVGGAVDGWLLQRCGHKYSTLQILEVAIRIKKELMEGKRLKMPDIEILPNFVGGDKGQKKAKAPRKPSVAKVNIHKKAKSTGVGAGARNTQFPTPGPSNQLGMGYGFGQAGGPPAGDGARVAPALPPIHPGYDGTAPRNAARTVPRVQYSNLFGGIPEGKAQGTVDNQRQQAPQRPYAALPGLPGLPLPVMQPALAQPNPYGQRNYPGSHSRSHSEIRSSQAPPYFGHHHNGNQPAGQSSGANHLPSFPSMGNNDRGHYGTHNAAPFDFSQSNDHYSTPPTANDNIGNGFNSSWPMQNPRPQPSSMMGPYPPISGVSPNGLTNGSTNGYGSYGSGAKHTRSQSNPVPSSYRSPHLSAGQSQYQGAPQYPGQRPGDSYGNGQYSNGY